MGAWWRCWAAYPVILGERGGGAKTWHEWAFLFVKEGEERVGLYCTCTALVLCTGGSCSMLG